MTDVNNDNELELILALYSDGRAIEQIAEQTGKSKEYVRQKIQVNPDTFEDIKNLPNKSDCLRVHRVRSMADEMIQKFLEDMSNDNEKAAKNIDRISRIAKDYAYRAQLIDGKATENITVDSDPFNIVITKTYESQNTENGTQDIDSVQE